MLKKMKLSYFKEVSIILSICIYLYSLKFIEHQHYIRHGAAYWGVRINKTDCSLDVQSKWKS